MRGTRDPHWPRWAAVEFWKIDCDYYKNGLQLRMHLMVMAEDKWSTTALDGARLGGIEPSEREKNELWRARHQRSRAGEGSVTGVSSTHTHWLPLPSSHARPKTAREDVDPARTQRTQTLFFSIRLTSFDWYRYLSFWMQIWLKILQK